MRTRTLIRLDKLVGLPLCGLVFALTLPARLVPRRRPPGEACRRIAVIKLLGMGSVLLATPMLRRLRRSHPGARIDFVTFASNAELVRRIAAVDRVVVVPNRSLLALAAALPGLLLRLRRERYDLALDLEFYSRLSSLLSWVIGARRRVGFFVRDRWRGSLLTDPVYFNPTVPYGRAVMALLRPLPREPSESRDAEDLAGLLVPAVAPDEAAACWRRLCGLGVPPTGAYVVVNPNASDLCFERRWPSERFARLIERFETEIAPVERFVFIGTGAESAHVARVLGLMAPQARARCLDLSGRTSVADLMVLISHAALMVTNDSGPMHLAAALRVPTVSFFGPETPALYGPVGDHHLVFYAGHWCSPCLSVYNAKIAMCAGENECMRRIGLEDVVARTAVFCREKVGLAPPRPRGPVAPAPADGHDDQGRRRDAS